jgi:hypothetical protein
MRIGRWDTLFLLQVKHMETKDDLRILRARVEDMERRISIISRQAGSTAAHLIGEVVDKGNMPTSLPGVFAVHPTSISADAVENSVPTLTSEDVDGIAFVVLGSRAPKAGYHLVGNLVDGRWVAEVSSKICNLTDNAKISVNLYRCGNLSLKIAGATVEVELWDEEAEEWTLVGTDVTDSNGDGEVPITEEGRYRLTLTHVSYAPFIYETDAVCGGNNTFFAIDDTVRLISRLHGLLTAGLQCPDDGHVHGHGPCLHRDRATRAGRLLGPRI